MLIKRPRTDRLAEVIGLRNQGFFRDALDALDKLNPDTINQSQSRAIRAELLERVGRVREAESIIRTLRLTKNLGNIERSLCDFVQARIDIDRGNVAEAIDNLNRSIRVADLAGDPERKCLAQLKLFVLLSDRVGTDATAALLADLRSTAARTGNVQILSCVHIYFAQIEALRGSVQSARRHLALANGLLTDSPSVWLESVVENISLGLAIMTSEFELAQAHARRGLDLVRRTGGTTEYAVNQANSGFLWHCLGRLDEAVQCYERALGLMVAGNDVYKGTLDSLARVRLSQGRLDECEALLSQIQPRDLLETSQPTYVMRHQLVTRAKLAIARRDGAQATLILEDARRAAELARDDALLASTLLGKVGVSILGAHSSSAKDHLDRLFPLLRGNADLYAQYERAVGEVALQDGYPGTAFDHVLRSSRIYEGLHHLQGLSELHQSTSWERVSTPSSEPRSLVASALSSVAAILSNPQHAEFSARELIALLASSDIARKSAVKSSDLVSSGPGVLAENTESTPEGTATRRRTIRIGESNGKIFEVELETADNIEAVALVNAATTLMSCAAELRKARDDKRERATIWPIDEMRANPDRIVLNGQMREVITYAQRIARSKISVLITGESGTGKEIIARVIHDFSDRATKPFIPLNCAAVPRDLLESQLFGHRRGSFTGAERDQLGLIRHATGGTLFLDEVGEMSLDLQPKLLRFLESGEIAPLGEPTPVHIDVRIVAATNSNLEDAVREGRFREDLYYRLNVVPLKIKPLRERRDEIPALVSQFLIQAVREFKKGHLDIAEDAMDKLMVYRWPGNVRQLQNEIRRMVALAEPNSTLERDAISRDILDALPHHRPISLNGSEISVSLGDKLLPTLSRIECEMIKAALRDNQGRLEPAAKSLGISRKGLYLKRQRLGL